MKNAINNYELQANEFLTECNASVTCKYSNTGKYFDTDKEDRDTYNVTIETPRGKMSFKFGQSIAKKGGFTYANVYDNGNGGPTSNKLSAYRGLYKFASRETATRYGGSGFAVKEVKREAPTAYDVLACLTKYHPGTLENFCDEFGYDIDSKKAEKTYYAVLKEYADLSAIFTPVQLEKMQEIQ